MGKKIAILAADGYEDMELWYPRFRLLEAGFDAVIAAADLKDRASKHGYITDVQLATADLRRRRLHRGDHPRRDQGGGEHPHGPGGRPVRASDARQRKSRRLDLPRGLGADLGLHRQGEKIDVLRRDEGRPDRGRALYVDEEVAVDGNLISSRKPSDLPAFMKEILSRLD